jgi:hypothetical protein
MPLFLSQFSLGDPRSAKVLFGRRAWDYKNWQTNGLGVRFIS